jgi:hypothetical protein
MKPSGNRQRLPGVGSDRLLGRLMRSMRDLQWQPWIQTIAILLASVWGIYTFIWQDILVPSWQPAHINLAISATPAAARTSKGGATEVLLKISIVNPSDRKLYLLANGWQIQESFRRRSREPDFQASADSALRGAALVHVERGSNREVGSTLAIGRLFDDEFIQPGETLNRTILVSIPPAVDAIEFNVVIPTLIRHPDAQLFHGRRLEWSFSQDEQLIPVLCQPSPAGFSRSSGCAVVGAQDVEKQLKRFDERVQIFTRTEQLAIAHPAGR